MNPVEVPALLRQLMHLLEDTKGNVLVLGAATLPVLLAAAGFGIDTVQMTVWKRELQRAADSAAIAGGYAESLGDDVSSAVRTALEKNPHATLAEAEKVIVGPALGYATTVQVEIRAEPELTFMRLFGVSSTSLTLRATAALADDDHKFCVVALHDQDDTGVTISGGGQINLNCGMHTNSPHKRAIDFNGSTQLIAPVIAAVGGLDTTAANYVPPTLLEPNSVPQRDPLEHLADPPAQSCTGKPLTVRASTAQILSPGCYTGLDLQGAATLLPGTYYVNGGDVEFGSKATVIGAGVTIVMTGRNGQAGDVKWNGTASVNLTSSDSGEYAGVLFFRDRRSVNKQLKINGNATTRLTGAMYFPTSDIRIGGSAAMNVKCLQLVSQRIEFAGGVTIENDCPTESGADSFSHLRVRLVA